MYVTINGTSYISGDFGKYDGKVKNYYSAYGRNAVDNFNQYESNHRQKIVDMKCKTLEDFEEYDRRLGINLSKTTPLNFVYKYMPGKIENGEIEKTSLMAAAYEELGGESVSLDSLNGRCQTDMVALDLNKDKQIDIAEFATAILSADAFSNGFISFKNIDGTITKEGKDNFTKFGSERNKNIAYLTYASLYDFYKLGEAKEEFMKNPDNFAPNEI